MPQPNMPVIEDDSAIARLQACIEGLRETGDVAETECRTLARRLTANCFHLVAVGQFKRGKTSLINALIGEDLLPVSVIPLTSIVTLLEYGDMPDVRVRYYDGREGQVSKEDLDEFVTEKGNPDNEKGINEVVVTWPSAWLKSGVRLVDTPGIGSVYHHNTDQALRFLPRADAVLLVLSAEQPVSQAESDFLKQVAEYAGKMFLIFNKADLLDQADLKESEDFAMQTVTAVLGARVPFFPVSAKLARQARLEGSPEKLARSGFPAFSAALRRFLDNEKGNALVTLSRQRLAAVDIAGALLPGIFPQGAFRAHR